MARFRHSLSGAPGRKSGPELVTVEDFHRECIRIAAELQTARDSSGMLSFSSGETDAA